MQQMEEDESRGENPHELVKSIKVWGVGVRCWRSHLAAYGGR